MKNKINLGGLFMDSSNQLPPDKSSPFTKDDAYRTLEIINTWINNIDVKVSF